MDSRPRTSSARNFTEVESDAATYVVVFESADRDFFVAHGDMDFVEDPQAAAAAGDSIAGDPNLNPLLRLHERLRGLPQITVGKIAGLARGGGGEFLLAMDMRFAAIETTGLAQMEAAIGIIPAVAERSTCRGSSGAPERSRSFSAPSYSTRSPPKSTV